MAESIGKQLKQARLKQGLSVEDIVHETRIPETGVKSLEEDDYSSFPSPTYARSFLNIYSEHLEVDASEIIDAMGTPKTAPGAANQESFEPSIDLTPGNERIPIFKGVRERREGNTMATVLWSVAMILLVPTVFFYGRLGVNKEHQAALARVRAETEAQVIKRLSGEEGANAEQPAPAPEDNLSKTPSLTPDQAELNALVGVSNGTPPAASNGETGSEFGINPASPPVTILQAPPGSTPNDGGALPSNNPSSETGTPN